MKRTPLFDVRRSRWRTYAGVAGALALLASLAPGCDEETADGPDADAQQARGAGEDVASPAAEVQGAEAEGPPSPDAADAVPGLATVECQPPTQDDLAPGEPVAALDATGTGACAGKTLGDVIAQIHQEHPELLDIQEVFIGDEYLGDGSFIYPYLRADGGFSIVLKRGLGDCPAGCTDTYYFYFTTDQTCEAVDAGHYHPAWSEEKDCLEADGAPLWGHPLPPDPIHSCGEDNSPQDISGSYEMLATGVWEPCAEYGGQLEPVTIAGVVTVVVSQDPADPGLGTVVVEGAGHPLVDGQSFSAEFVRRRFRAVDEFSNLPSNCPQQHTVVLEYDFECIHPGQISENDFGSADCSLCKGNMHLSLDQLAAGP